MLYNEFAKKVNISLDTASVGIFNIQNIADYAISIRGQGAPPVYPEFSEIRLPFQYTWLEWKEDHYSSNGQLIKAHLAMLVTKRSNDELLVVAFNMNSYHGLSVIWEGTLYPTLMKDGRAAYGANRQDYFSDIFYDVRSVFVYPGSEVSPDQIEEQTTVLLKSMMYIFLTTALFLACKNIEKKDHAVSHKLMKASTKRGRPYYYEKYYTLEIESARKILSKEGSAEIVGIQKAFHICRGHFKTYTEEAPLFGKFVGTVFCPAHAKGNKEIGKVSKIYKPKI